LDERTSKLETGLPNAAMLALSQQLVAVQLGGLRSPPHGSPFTAQRREEKQRKEEVKDCNSSPLTKKR